MHGCTSAASTRMRSLVRNFATRINWCATDVLQPSPPFQCCVLQEETSSLPNISGMISCTPAYVTDALWHIIGGGTLKPNLLCADDYSGMVNSCIVKSTIITSSSSFKKSELKLFFLSFLKSVKQFLKSMLAIQLLAHSTRTIWKGFKHANWSWTNLAHRPDKTIIVGVSYV